MADEQKLHLLVCLGIAALLLGGLAMVASGCGPSFSGGDNQGNRDAGMDAAQQDVYEPDVASESDGGGEVDGAVCRTVLCGSPPVCCGADQECVEGQCLPICQSGVRCGADQATCCQAGQVCMQDQCVSPGGPCHDSYDCIQPGWFCEPTLGRCLPQPQQVDCEVRPNFQDIQVTVEWSWQDEEIISMPAVADLDGDGVPEVVVNTTQQDGLGWPGGMVVVLNGRTGQEKYRLPENPAQGTYGSHGRSTVGLGDFDGDGLPDIVYAGRPVDGQSGGMSLIVAVKGSTGSLLWTSHDAQGRDYPVRVVNGAPTLANLDQDPQAEIVFGALVIDNDGRVLADAGMQPGEGGAFGTNDSYTGGISAVADLDGDGKPEIVSGRDAWKFTGSSLQQYWQASTPDGYPGIADVNLDGRPEVVLVASSTVFILNGQTGQVMSQIAIPGGTNNNLGGPPTIADYDGDGRPEIGVAGGYAYTVYDIGTAGELSVLWSQPTQDLSSNVTGSSVFDFQGDGVSEVVYGDECYTRVYSGIDGRVEVQIPNTSATIHEYPLVVDVDADGNSEILVVGNRQPTPTPCPYTQVTRGLFVYGDVNDEWVPTRRVWTQHTYHVTNADSNGNVPQTEVDNWTLPGLNNYRQNVQGEGVFNAPDLAVELTAGLSSCPLKIVLQARVTNQGSLGVPAGVQVDFYEGQDASGTHLGSATTQQDLLPGASTVVTLEVDAPIQPTSYYATVDGNGAVTECVEDNNDSVDPDVSCPVVE